MKGTAKKQATESTFTGFAPDVFAFFRELEKRQDRDWFLANRHRYDEGAHAQMSALIVELNELLAKRRIPLGGDPKRAIFRIYRDVRFSHDKRPYNARISAALSTGKHGGGHLYLHIADDECFVGAGFHQPDAPVLTKLREAIAAKPKAFLTVVAELRSHKLKLDDDADALKRLPRGFEDADESIAEFLRRKSFDVFRPLTKSDVQKPTLPSRIADFADEALPLLKFGWKALQT